MLGVLCSLLTGCVWCESMFLPFFEWLYSICDGNLWSSVCMPSWCPVWGPACVCVRVPVCVCVSLRVCSNPYHWVMSSQLLGGWQTVSAPQHEALWFACQPDWQVNETSQGLPSLPLGDWDWVTASEQPERASLNLKVISLTLSFSLSASLSLFKHIFLFLSLSFQASLTSFSPGHFCPFL